MDDAAPIYEYFQRLGLEPEVGVLYTVLSKQGQSSALQLAKQSGISRTQVYRHLEILQHYGLASAEQLTYGTLYRALPLSNLEGTFATRESELKNLRTNLKDMTQLLQALAGGTGPKATVQHYYGLAGLKQVNWNLTKADKEFRVFEVAHLDMHLDKTFARRCRERYIERGLVSYDLTNATRVTAAELEPFTPGHSLFRHIDPKILAINFELFIYNDLITLVDYSKEQQMALEIHHPTLQAMMRQLYDAMWAIATPMAIEK